MTADIQSIRGTKTESNLVAAYLSEAQAYSRYTFYAQKAVKESYFPIQQAFLETAANELHHCKVFFKFLQGGQVMAQVPTDSGVIGTTEENLQISINEEVQEGVQFYQEAAKVAQQEGFDKIASHFLAIASIEQRHEARFRTFLEQVKNGTVWKRDEPIIWRCLVCGYQFEGTEPPLICPGCDHPRQHYIGLDMCKA